MTTSVQSLNPAGHWSQLVAAGVLGTDRLGGKLPSVSGPSGALIERISTAGTAERLLSAVAILAPYVRAGGRPPQGKKPDLRLSAVDDPPECSARGGRHLARILQGEFPFLLTECCEAAAQCGVRAADEMLPALLDHCRAADAARVETFQKVLNRRGTWLADLNPDWRDVVCGGPSEDFAMVWKTGTRDQRLNALKELRRLDPDRARALVAETWEQESLEDREAIVECSAIKLSLDDEPFLECALDDKRKPVRMAAADFLARLSDSAFRRRMEVRATPLLAFSRKKKLLGARELVLEVAPPRSTDKAMTRDGIEGKKKEGLGEKAHVLCQLLAATRLSAWEEAAQGTPEQIVAASVETDWTRALIWGWSHAAVRQQSAAWSVALMKMYVREPEPFYGAHVGDLVRCIEPSLREELAQETLRRDYAGFGDHPRLIVLGGCNHPWSDTLSRAVLNWLRGHFGNAGAEHDHALRGDVSRTFSRFMSPSTADEAAQGWKRDSAFWHKADDAMVAALSGTLAFRRAMLKELSA